MEEIKTCPICGHKETDKEPNGNLIHIMNPDEFIQGSIRRIMEEKECCFSCAFWYEKINPSKKKDDSAVWIRVGHESRVVHPTRKGDYFKGSGGHSFYFQMYDGTLIHSQNVWYQGDIPEIFWKELPDNATILSKETYEIALKESKKRDHLFTSYQKERKALFWQII